MDSCCAVCSSNARRLASSRTMESRSGSRLTLTMPRTMTITSITTATSISVKPLFPPRPEEKQNGVGQLIAVFSPEQIELAPVLGILLDPVPFTDGHETKAAILGRVFTPPEKPPADEARR